MSVYQTASDGVGGQYPAVPAPFNSSDSKRILSLSDSLGGHPGTVLACKAMGPCCRKVVRHPRKLRRSISKRDLRQGVDGRHSTVSMVLRQYFSALRLPAGLMVYPLPIARDTCYAGNGNGVARADAVAVLVPYLGVRQRIRHLRLAQPAGSIGVFFTRSAVFGSVRIHARSGRSAPLGRSCRHLLDALPYDVIAITF